MIDSKHESFSNGTLVCGPFGWTTYAVIQGKNLTKMDYLQDLSASAGLGAAGMPGYASTTCKHQITWLQNVEVACMYYISMKQSTLTENFSYMALIYILPLRFVGV